MSKPTAIAWSGGRPIYSRLPGVNGGYQDDEGDNPADWLTAYFDALLVEVKAKVDDLPRQLDPQACDPEWLDFLAPLCGFSDEYWDASFPISVKRSLLSNAYTLLWPNKGSEIVLTWLLAVFGIAHQLWLGDSFTLGVSTFPGTIGSPEWQFYILLPLQYLRESPEFARAEQIKRLYSPAFCDSLVAYDEFYCGFSVLGDPIFEEIPEEAVPRLLTESGERLLTEDGTVILEM